MSAEIIPFAFNDHLVRTVRRGEEPWFVGKDVCSVLDISKHHQALDRLDKDERGTYTVGTPSGDQSMVIISEAGVYRLVFTSRKAEAEAFKRWLAHDVLPALRRDGRYGAQRPSATLPDDLGEAPAGILTLKLAMVREARLLFGQSRARALWGQLALPGVPYASPTPDEASMYCLRHLLVEPTEDGEAVMQLIDRAMAEEKTDEDTGAVATLASMGIRVDVEGNGIIIANATTPFLATCFEGTPFGENRHPRLLRRLPGAKPMYSQRYGRLHSRGTWIPASLCDMDPI